MVRSFLTWGAALSALAVLTPCEVDAQVENLVPPAGAMMWHYECQPGTQCPTKCTVKGTELFSTSNYVSLTILKIPDQVYWFRIDTGQTNVDYVAQADEMHRERNRAFLDQQLCLADDTENSRSSLLVPHRHGSDECRLRRAGRRNAP